MACEARLALNLVLSLSHLERQALDGAAIYTLECADGAYYTGITRRSVEERVSDYAQ
jgi:hypothetical protein